MHEAKKSARGGVVGDSRGRQVIRVEDVMEELEAGVEGQMEGVNERFVVWRRTTI